MKKFSVNILILATLILLLGQSIVVMAAGTTVYGDCKDSAGKIVDKGTNVEQGKCPAGSTWYPKTEGSTGAGGGEEVDPLVTYTFLAPLPCDTNANPKIEGCDENGQLKTFNAADKGKLGLYLNVMIKIFIGICAVLAVVMIVLGGLEYITSELPGNKEDGKNRITNAIFGLVLAIGAYILLYTINPQLLNTDLSSLTDAKLFVGEDIPQPAPTGGQAYSGTNYKKDDVWYDPTKDTLPTLPAGVTKNYQECTKVGQPSGCLSTKGLLLTNIQNVQRKCPNVPLTLNGGTEFWHHSVNTTHRLNSATVDIKSSPALNACLSEGEALVNPKMYGGLYYYEGNHWHVR